eukprot:s747_g8.t1
MRLLAVQGEKRGERRGNLNFTNTLDFGVSILINACGCVHSSQHQLVSYHGGAVPRISAVAQLAIACRFCWARTPAWRICCLNAGQCECDAFGGGDSRRSPDVPGARSLAGRGDLWWQRAGAITEDSLWLSGSRGGSQLGEWHRQCFSGLWKPDLQCHAQQHWKWAQRAMVAHECPWCAPAAEPKTAAAPRTSRLSVVVRKRPMNKREVQTAQQDVVMCRESAVVVREPKLKVDLTKYVEEHNFLFDQAFDENVTNESLYKSCVQPVIDAVFHKAKCTCFAYGQTGSGKTFTMMGPPKRQVENLLPEERIPGIFLLASQDLFRGVASKEYSHLGVFIAFYEIYCGKLFDLLNNRQILHARENAKGNVVIAGLQDHCIGNVQDLMEVIESGLNSRTTGVTGANVDSSRSHAILQISLKDLSSKEEHGKISFIDLAGSERGADTLDTDRQTRMDGAEINKSLLALKECIRALDQQLDHTPFRGSKLTQVLKDSFVGANCRTVGYGVYNGVTGAAPPK